MCWFVSGSGRDVSLCVGQHQELSVILHISALMKIQSWFLSMYWPVSRAEHVLVCVFTIREPGMRVQVSARIKSSACTSTSWPVLKAEHGWRAFGVVLVSWHLAIHWGLCVCLHVYASAQDLAHISMLLGWSCHVSACVSKHQRLWMYLRTMAGVCKHRAEHVPEFVGLYQGDEHEFAFLAFACSCMHLCVQSSSYVTTYQVLGMYARCVYLMCLHVSKAAYLDALRVWNVSACVSMCQELGIYLHMLARIKGWACLQAS
jgi:hypothetical protein